MPALPEKGIEAVSSFHLRWRKPKSIGSALWVESCIWNPIKVNFSGQAEWIECMFALVFVKMGEGQRLSIASWISQFALLILPSDRPVLVGYRGLFEAQVLKFLRNENDLFVHGVEGNRGWF